MKEFLLTSQLVENVWEHLILPTLEPLFSGGQIFKRKTIHVVVVYSPQKKSFEDSIIGEFTFSDVPKEDWNSPYDEIARSKAEVSWRTGKSTYHVVVRKPHLLENGETRYYGSCILEGVIVAASGQQQFFDEMISYSFAAAINAAVKREQDLWEELTGGYDQSGISLDKLREDPRSWS